MLILKIMYHLQAMVCMMLLKLIYQFGGQIDRRKICYLPQGLLADD